MSLIVRVTRSDGEVWTINATPVAMQMAVHYAGVDCDLGEEDKDFYATVNLLFSQYCNDDFSAVIDWISNNTEEGQIEKLAIKIENIVSDDPVYYEEWEKVSDDEQTTDE